MTTTNRTKMTLIHDLWLIFCQNGVFWFILLSKWRFAALAFFLYGVCRTQTIKNQQYELQQIYNQIAGSRSAGC